MPSLAIMLDGVTVKEVELANPRTTIGRRSTNDVVIDHLAVSGNHAVLHLKGQAAEIEDLHSTNGTYVNGEPVARQALRDGDLLGIGRYQIRFRDPASPAGASRVGVVRVLSGPGAGREVTLVKVVTTLGKPGEAVASITHRPHGFVLNHVEGAQRPQVNGSTMLDAHHLSDGDRIALGGVDMEFVLR